MTCIYNRDDVIYYALSTDVVANKIPSTATSSGAVVKGAWVYLTDTGTWYVVKEDLTLGTLNMSGAVLQTTGGTGYIATGSFTGSSASKLYNVNSTITPAVGSLMEIKNAFRIAGGSGYITDIDLVTSASPMTAVLKLHFFSGSNVTLAPDSGSWIDLIADESYHMADFTMPALATSGSLSTCARISTTDPAVGTQPRVLVSAIPGSTSLYVGLQTTSSFTSTASQVWIVKPHMDQN
jgi:hypothetical protein